MVDEDVYALKNLLPAGVIRLFFNSDSTTSTKPPATESDDWNALTPFLEAHELQCTTVSLPRLHEIDFLVLHRYVRATWRLPEDDACGFVHIRIYLIPCDLPGGHILLRERPRLMNHKRKTLISLLTETNRSPRAWANCAEPSDGFEPFLSRQHDHRTLSEIYSDLPSPAVNPSTFLSGTDPRTQKAFRRALYWESPPGMRPLYTYQRRTVARMLQQELDPGTVPDPLYIPIHGVQVEGSAKCKTFYLQPSTMEALSECPMRSQPKGGILCEEMGTGKTCMVLGLIMATKHQLSSPEEPLWDEPERPILTPLAFHHFPTGEFECARQVARIKARQSGIPSLVEMLTHIIRVSPGLISPVGFNESLRERLPDHLWEPLMENQPFYHVFERDPGTASSRRKFTDRGPRKFFLTSATLVIVPRAILEQWNSEINKHCEDGSIRHISLDIGPKTRPMPCAQKLASMYDIVLVTHEKFSTEKSCGNPSWLHTWDQCRCPVIGRSRVPNCTCDLKQLIYSGPVSPLLKIRWKRLVVDEGHASAAATNFARLCQELKAERRWIVSGTPTRNLMGLSLGRSEYPETAEEAPILDDKDVEESVSIVRSEVSAFDGELGYPSDPIEDPPRQWTRIDRDDLAKLGDMISKFIGVPQFAHDANSFRKMVAAPLLDRNGPGLGATQVVSQVMSQVMFRHQIQDVERDLPEKLPPLKEKTVSLKFHPLAAKTYNVLQAGIAVNAVDSQRRDQDYLFHPMARAALRQTLENLTQTMFWRTDHTIFDIEGALRRSQEALQTALKRNLPDSDIKLVEDSIRVQREALEDELWTAVMRCDDNPFVVRGLSPALQAAWLKMGVHLFENRDAMLDPDRLCKLRDVLLRSPLISERDLITHGVDVAMEEARMMELYEEWQRRRKRKARLDEGGATENLKVKKFNGQDLILKLTGDINRRERGGVGGHTSVSFGPTPSITGNFSSISIGKSASSKVNYIIRKVRKHAAKEKFLIFSAFPLSLAYVEDALRLAQIRYLKYTSGINAHQRQQSVVTFETSDKYRVLLMELKLGARGLNIVKASRIIFCEPVWQGDVESQAIKRAHRIGQRCHKLKVTTLVMRGTSEEAMVTRRHALRRKSERLPAMEEDASLSRFLQNPTFTRPEDIEAADVASLVMPLMAGGTRGEADGEVEVEVEAEAERAVKKRKTVHFG